MRTRPVRVGHAKAAPGPSPIIGPYLGDDDVCSTVRYMARVITCTIDKVPRDDDVAEITIDRIRTNRVFASGTAPPTYTASYFRSRVPRI